MSAGVRRDDAGCPKQHPAHRLTIAPTHPPTHRRLYQRHLGLHAGAPHLVFVHYHKVHDVLFLEFKGGRHMRSEQGSTGIW